MRLFILDETPVGSRPPKSFYLINRLVQPDPPVFEFSLLVKLLRVEVLRLSQFVEGSLEFLALRLEFIILVEVMRVGQ